MKCLVANPTTFVRNVCTLFLSGWLHFSKQNFPREHCPREVLSSSKTTQFCTRNKKFQQLHSANAALNIRVLIRTQRNVVTDAYKRYVREPLWELCIHGQNMAEIVLQEMKRRSISRSGSAARTRWLRTREPKLFQMRNSFFDGAVPSQDTLRALPSFGNDWTTNTLRMIRFKAAFEVFQYAES